MASDVWREDPLIAPPVTKIVQMDTRTNARKVPACLSPSVLSRFGYRLGTSDSICLDQADEHLPIAWNGHRPRGLDDTASVGEPSLTRVELGCVTVLAALARTSQIVQNIKVPWG